MVIIRLMGGLGNQLFQYALGFCLKQDGIAVKMDETTAQSFEHKRKVQLHEMGVSYDTADVAEIEEYLDNSKDLFKRVKRKFFGSKSKLKAEKSMWFDASFLESDDKYFSGYFQTEKYFEKYADELKDNLSIQSVKLSGESDGYKDMILNTNSVAVHIRRGDYLSQEFKDVYGGICTDIYYKSAIGYMNGQLENPVYYIFSNDPDWCKQEYQGDEYVIVDCNDEEHGYMDLVLMGMCKHNIIANSSFSWWGAWLNDNKDKIVIAPSKWINNQETPDIWSKDMKVKIDRQGNVCQ